MYQFCFKMLMSAQNQTRQFVTKMLIVVTQWEITVANVSVVILEMVQHVKVSTCLHL